MNAIMNDNEEPMPQLFDKLLVKAYAGTFSTVTLSAIANYLPHYEDLRLLASFLSVCVGLLTCLYTLTKLYDWTERRYRVWKLRRKK